MSKNTQSLTSTNLNSSSRNKVNTMKQLIQSDLFTMSTIIRYSGAQILRKENLAEHSYYVTILSDLIAEDLQKRFPSKNIDKYKVLSYALYHDYEETYTGDIISIFKYKSETLKEELDSISQILLKEGTSLNFDGNEHLSKRISDSALEYERNKSTTLENRIVKFCDTLQSLIYVINEINLGNTYMKPIFQRIIKSTIKKYSKSYIFRPYTQELLELIDEGQIIKSNIFNIDREEFKNIIITEDQVEQVGQPQV